MTIRHVVRATTLQVEEIRYRLFDNGTAKTGVFTPELGAMHIVDVSGGGFSITAPTLDANTGIYQTGKTIAFHVSGASLSNTLTVNAPGGGTIAGGSSFVFDTPLVAEFMLVGTDYKLVKISPSTVISNTSQISAGAGSLGSGSGDRYLFWQGGGTATAQTRVQELDMPKACTIRNMYVRVGNPRGNGNDVDYTLVKNGTPTALTVTVPSTTAAGNDVTNQVTVAKGDTLRLLVEKPSGALGTSPRDIVVAMEVL